MDRLLVFSRAFRLRMVRVTFVLFTFLLLWGLAAAPLAYAQSLSFEKTWGALNNDYGMGVAVDSSSGNIYVAGYKTEGTAGGEDILLLKYNSLGTLQWKLTWGGAEDDEGHGVAVDSSSGNIYVTGHTFSFGNGSDVVLLRFNSAGALQWQKTWGGTSNELGYGVAVDGSGSIYVTGATYISGAGGFTLVLLKFDSSGGLLWQKTWGGNGYDVGLGVAVDGSGNIYVTGQTNSVGAGNMDVVLLKFDSSGGLLWQHTWGGPDDDEGHGVAVDGSGSIYVTGKMYRGAVLLDDVVLLKFSSVGGLVWGRTWGGLDYDCGLGVAVDGSGNIHVTGWTMSFGTGSRDVLLLKFDSEGVLQWQMTWGGDADDWGWGVAIQRSNLYFAGYTQNAVRNLSNATGTVALESGIRQTPAFTPDNSTYTPGAPDGIVSTPSGSETYSGGFDVFLLALTYGGPPSIPAVVADVEGFASSPTNGTLLVIGDLALNPHGSKPSGVGYQQGRDTTPLGFVSGMLGSVQPSKFDTNTAWISSDGRPLNTTTPTLIFSIGGPGINAVTYYYETTSTAADKAPVKFGYNSTYFYWMFTGNGTKVPGSEILITSTSVPPGTSDVFVIQILEDADGRLVVLMYGTRYTGTWAAAEYFKFIVYPDIVSYRDSYYIVRWTDAASGPDADFVPGAGDTFQIIAQGIP